ncbi:peroxiredoxin family protein [Bacteroides oleiciplenus]|uniref:Thioredoxin domain-containing protein n=1 Tax=Bacteroides oleiciplenus YIT 12058 TaxID=742727 RepID=K9EGH4_9BACE|nr:TlpA disulfide reductase family protein [Bacteroides oleiciplenus]EKU90037.1 hypothetical protein HMPREF9447_02872 [Bacteroides oleiciplenus YIT 12058]
MKKLLVLLSFLFTINAGNAQENKKEYLQKVLNNLEKVESASYTSFNESWQPGDTVPIFTYSRYINEYNNPKDSTIGASYASFETKDMDKMDFCYNGNKRVLIYDDDKAIVEDDFTARPLPFRLVEPPFYNYTKNIIKYALQTKDNITVDLQDKGDDYFFRLVIEEDTQVEFFGKAYHMPETPFYTEPTSIYEIWIHKSNNLPYKARREMSHSISAKTITTVEFNRLSIQDFNMSDYYPKEYTIEPYRYGNQKPNSIPDLTGQLAPEWTLNDSNGNPVSLANLKSKVLLINFTGIGCGACQAAVPFLKELKGKFSNEDFDLIAIEGWSRKEHSIQVYANNKKLNYTILNANDQVIKDYQTGNAAPFFFILDEHHIIRKVIRGYGNERTDKEIMDAITELL